MLSKFQTSFSYYCFRPAVAYETPSHSVVGYSKKRFSNAEVDFDETGERERCNAVLISEFLETF